MSDEFERLQGFNAEKLQKLIELNRQEKEKYNLMVSASGEISAFLNLMQAFSSVDPGFSKVLDSLIKIFGMSVKSELVDELERLIDDVFTDENTTKIEDGGTAVGEMISEMIKVEDSATLVKDSLGLLSSALQWAATNTEALNRFINPIGTAFGKLKETFESLLKSVNASSNVLQDFFGSITDTISNIGNTEGSRNRNQIGSIEWFQDIFGW